MLRYTKKDLNHDGEQVNLFFVLRFCRARKFDEQKIKLLLKAYVDYYNLKKDVLAKKFSQHFEAERNISRITYYKTDLDGDPVIYDRICLMDFDVMKEKSSVENIEDFYYCFLFRFWGIIAPMASARKNKRVDKAVIIFDFKNVNPFKFITGDIGKFLKIAIRCAQDYFPEISKKILVINAPKLFGILWNFAKILLDKDIIDKVSIHSSDTLAILK